MRRKLFFTYSVPMTLTFVYLTSNVVFQLLVSMI